MHRIDHETAEIDPITGEPLFTEGDPEFQVPATVVTADWLNVVQEEIAQAIERFMPLSASRSQLALVLNLLADSMLISSALDMTDNGASGNVARYATDTTNMLIVAMTRAQTDPIRETYDGGRSWSTPSLPSLGGGPEAALVDVTWGDDRFMAVGALGTIRTRTAVAGWTRQTPAASYVGDFTHVHYCEGLAQWFVGGSELDVGQLQRSLDNGVTWEQLSPPASTLYGPFASHDSIVVCGATGAILRTTAGLVWTATTLDVPLDAAESIVAISHLPGGWIALASSNSKVVAVYVSSNALSWTRHSFPASPFFYTNLSISVDPRSGAIYATMANDSIGIAIPTTFGEFLAPEVILRANAEGDRHIQRVGKRFAYTLDNKIYLSGIQIL